jgi:hypothetical protein
VNSSQAGHRLEGQGTTQSSAKPGSPHGDATDDTSALSRRTFGLRTVSWCVKSPTSTPEIIARHALTDEQALLAKVRYNRLIDVFLGITAYSLQNHLRTKIPNYGQIEIDELYVGIDSRGGQYIVPVQAKGGTDVLGAIQTTQDITFCQTEKIARALSAQFLANDMIALFETTFDGDEVSIVRERHYKLTESEAMSAADLKVYRMAEPD